MIPDDASVFTGVCATMLRITMTRSVEVLEKETSVKSMFRGFVV
jgi:hypothetical protein